MFPGDLVNCLLLLSSLILSIPRLFQEVFHCVKVSTRLNTEMFSTQIFKVGDQMSVGVGGGTGHRCSRDVVEV